MPANSQFRDLLQGGTVTSSGTGLSMPFFHDSDLDDDFLKLVSHHTQKSDVTPGVVPVDGSVTRVTWTNDPETGKPLPNAPMEVFLNGVSVRSFTANAETGVHVFATPLPVVAGDHLAVYGGPAAGDNRLKTPVVTLYM